MATAEEYIDVLSKNKTENTVAGLTSVYNQNVAALDKLSGEIPQNYYEARRQTAGNDAILRQRLNESFAANGLNTGAVGQAQLAMNNQANANLAALNREQAAALSSLALQRTNLENEYRTNVQQAIANGEYDRANALYDEWKAQRSEAKSQVDTLVKAGVMPSAELIEASGYSSEYVQQLYNALYGQGYTGGYGGGGNPTPKEDPTPTPKPSDTAAPNEVFVKGMGRMKATDALRLVESGNAYTYEDEKGNTVVEMVKAPIRGAARMVT